MRKNRPRNCLNNQIFLDQKNKGSRIVGFPNENGIAVNLNCHFPFIMVSVAQLVESRIVIPAVVGSSPITHPILFIPPHKNIPTFVGFFMGEIYS